METTRRSLVARTVILAVIAVVAGLTLAEPAFAVCSGEQNIVWHLASGPRDPVQNARGERSDITLYNRSMNSDCTGYVTGSTTLALFTSTGSDWAEVGWQRQADGNFKWFVEYGVNNQSLARPDGTFGSLPGSPNCSVGAGDSPTFRVNEVPEGSGTWSFDINCQDSQGLRKAAPDWNTHGTEVGSRPTVEPWRFGGSSTGLRDDHTSAQWKDASGNWSNSNGFICAWDFVPDYNGDVVSNTHWDTVDENHGTNC